MHRKGVQYAKRAKAFTKIIRELTVATKEGGSEPESNPRLRAAIISAREVNAYSDGTKATVEQMASDVVAFLSWAAEPELEQRNRMGVRVFIFLGVFGFMFALYKRTWRGIKK